MFSHQNAAEPETLADLHAQDALHFRAMFIGLADLGADLARLVVAQAKDEADAFVAVKPPTDFTGRYARVMGALRQTVMLVQKLTEPAPAAKAVRPGPDRVVARKLIIRRVEDAIHRDAPEDAAERLHGELLERLEGAAFDDDLSQRPLAEIIKEICDDFGISGPDSLAWWKRRTPADIAILCERAAAPCGVRVEPSTPPGAARWHDAPPIRGP
jgi:hypothetical protein